MATVAVPLRKQKGQRATLTDSKAKSNVEVAAQDFAEHLGERFRPYLDLKRIDRAIKRPTCPCPTLKGSDGHTMLAQEFIGNIVRDIIATAQSQLAQQVIDALPVGDIHTADRLRDLFTRLGVKVGE